jgi:protoporphyrinogen oxidase
VSEKVAVVGGGISGLSAAYFILERGFCVELFEGTDQLGGLAATFDFNGLNIEKWYHFVCGGDHELIKLADRLGIGDKLRFQPTKTAFYYDGRYYPFGTPSDLLKFSPISLMSRFKFGLNITTSKYSKNWEKLDNVSAKEWLIERIGEKAYNVIWHPLLRVKFGNRYDRISAAWIWHRIHRVASSRKGLFSKEKMGYFMGGSQTLMTALENKVIELGGSIRLCSGVREIAKNDDTLELILDSGERLNFDKVVLAIPLPVAAETLKSLAPEFACALSSIDFVGVVCGIFRLKQKVTDAFWLNINDPRIAANGWIEYTNLNPLEEISPHKIVYIPFYVSLDDEWFSRDEAPLRSAFLAMLETVNPGLTESAVVDFRAFRSPYAQAICEVGFRDRVPSVKSPIENLFLLDSTQLYPSDRSLSSLIGLASKMVEDYF